MAIKRPVLRYYGGKWAIAPWIISHFPAHNSYIEPCMGALSVLLRKEPAKIETVGDIDHNIVTFFRVLRDRPDDLERAIKLTPWARAEYDLSCRLDDLGDIDDLERARLVAVRSFMSISGHTSQHSGIGFKTHKDPRSRKQTSYCAIQSMDLGPAAERLAQVQIENRDYADVIERFDDRDALIYFDPPYVQETRSSEHYAHEFADADHERAADLLTTCAGYVVISGYPSALYTRLYEDHGWIRVDSESLIQNSGSKRIESLWLSPRTWAALESERQPDAEQLGMFEDLP